MNIQLQGQVKKVFPMQTFQSGFRKQDILLTSDPQSRYPQDLLVSFMKDSTALLEGVSEGHMITVDGYLRGEEYNGRHYVKIVGNRVNGGV